MADERRRRAPTMTLDEIIEKAARDFNVDPVLIRAVRAHESGNSTAATSSAGAQGSMQIMPATGRRHGVTNLRDDSQAIPLAARLLAEGLDRYGNVEDALKYYHAGPNQRLWGTRTAAYPGLVLSQYQRLSTPTAAPAAPAAAPVAADNGAVQLAQLGVAPTLPAERPSTPARMPGGSRTTDPMASLPEEVRAYVTGSTPPAAQAVAPAAPSAPAATTPATEPVGRPIVQGPDASLPPGVRDYVTGRPEPGPIRVLGVDYDNNLTRRMQRGMWRGMRDVLDKPAQWAASGMEASGLTGAVNSSRLGQYMHLPTAEETREGNRRDRQQFDDTLGDSGAALLGRVGGNVTATGPILSTAGNLLRAGSAALSFSAPRAASVLSGVLDAGSIANPFARFGARALGGAAEGAATAGLVADPDKPMGDQLRSGALTGAVVNSTIAPAIGGAVRGVRNALFPQVRRSEARLAERAANMGIDVRGSQMGNSKFTHNLDSVLETIPGSGMAPRAAAQRTAYTRAVARTFGENTDEITQDVMEAARTRIGHTFDRVAAGTTLVPNAAFRGSMNAIRADIANIPLVDSEQRVLQRLLDNVDGTFAASNSISGQAYQALTRRGAPLDIASRSADPNVRFFAGRIRSTLDDLLEASAPRNLVADLRQARNQWKAMKTVEPLITSDHQINPGSLLARVRNSYGDYAYRGTNNDLSDLALIGHRFLRSPPDSGTSVRNSIRNLLTFGSGVLATGAMFQDPRLIATGLATTIGSAGAARGATAALGSRAYRNMLIRQGNTGHLVPPIPGAAGRYLGPYPLDAVANLRPSAVQGAVAAQEQDWNRRLPPVVDRR